MELYRTWTGQSQKSHQSHQSEKSKQIHQTSSQTSTRDPLVGHLNHLTVAQESALERFKAALHTRGLWKPGTSASRPSHDDATLLRYLRARKFDVIGAIGQFSDTEHWLKEQRVEELYENYDVEAYERARQMYPQWTGHRDRRGIPLYVYVVRHLDSKNVKAYQKDAEQYKKSLPYHKSLDTPAQLIPLFALYHNLLNFVLPLCSTLERPNPEVPVTNSTNIVDISNVGLTQFWNLKSHMQDASVLATAHYPETLDRIYIIGAPAFFPTVWGWIKRWFDPVTVSKIYILGKHEVRSTLSSFIHPDDFPKRYGGNLDWDFGTPPHMEEESLRAIEKDGRGGWVDGPCLWLDRKRFAVGSVDGKPRRPDSEIATLKPVVYAADRTGEPVHPNAAASPTLGMPVVAGEKHAIDSTEPEKLSAAANGAIPTPSHASGSVYPAHPPIPYQNTQAAAETDTETNEADPQLTHAELAEQANHTDAVVLVDPLHEEEALQTIPITDSGHTTGAQMNMHESLIHDMTIKMMQEESISIIPSHANGSAHHDELLVTSDPAKGLALETEKLRINGQMKPPMERFITAVEEVAVNGPA